MEWEEEKTNCENQIKKGLYLVSTPIGNLNDITLRAIEILRRSDYILCEDTRVSKNLLQRFEINSKLISNHKFNEKLNLNKIIEILNLGKIVSLVSDAGTPAISDPGTILINECLKKNVSVFPIPGPSAVSAAVSISGFSQKYFLAKSIIIQLVKINGINKKLTPPHINRDIAGGSDKISSSP
mgnify:CR=1 FL=1